MKTIQVNETGEPVHLLWTSGCDSTFRLLQLAILLKKKVQPYYVLTIRQSVYAEIYFMGKIKRELFKKFPWTRELVLPTFIYDYNEISESPEIRADFVELRKILELGEQYTHLAELRLWRKLPYLEMSIQKTDERFRKTIDDYLVRYETEIDSWYQLDEEYKDTPRFNCFGFYRFPLLDISKEDMFDIARENDFFELQNLSWFCHFPVMKKKFGEEPEFTPCGCCSVCNMSAMEGMAWRIPYWRRMKNRIQWKIIEIARLFNFRRKK